MMSTADTVENISLLDDIILNNDDLSEEAKRKFEFHHNILRSFNENRICILQNRSLTPVGRHLFLYNQDSHYKICKQVLNYVAINEEILQTRMPNHGPIVICGLPRTGSTLLYNLLACDPNCRAPLYREMYPKCMPPVPRTNIEEHKKKADALKSYMTYFYQLRPSRRNLSEIHPIYDIEEDGFILGQGGLNLLVDLKRFIDQIEMDKPLFDDEKTSSAYAYHEIFLRMLNSVDSPGSHWLLKNAWHTLFLNTLELHYPNVLLIMMHRNLEEALPSYCNLTLTAGSAYYDISDPENQHMLTAYAIRYAECITNSMIKFRTDDRRSQENYATRVFDVNYEDLVSQPINAVRNIYQHFNLNWSDEFETNMKTWLKESPQGKQGRHSYSLSQFNLTSEDIATRFAKYIEMFLSSKK